MSRPHSVVPAHIDTSVIGEEDPGASLEIFSNEALKNRARDIPPSPSAKTQQNNPYLTINCSNNGQCFTIQVQWQQPQEREFTDLLGLVIAEHAVISDVAWVHHRKTGQDPVQLEMSATADGRAAVQVKPAATSEQQAGVAAPRRKVLHEPFLAANDHAPYGALRHRK
ncbi:hypothetical protein PMI14_04688 [Acidovorax sp. CF316]|uniref:hypothetical protein n=1 Tax=Acidovorax sp. CF316 TaxID=1144317 RepID=UPI00026BD413|nr:hypothetical protein [Acidovorax sp. CF316]EJE50647.1 hypothetical protein PMI14_04688 [Acidovorax sp. CF316]